METDTAMFTLETAASRLLQGDECRDMWKTVKVETMLIGIFTVLEQ